MLKICVLGGGFIGRFYAESLIGRRGRDEVSMIYARREETAQRFASDYSVPNISTDMEAAIAHPDSQIVIIALPNYVHEEAVMLCVKHKKPVLCKQNRFLHFGWSGDEFRRYHNTLFSGSRASRV